MSEHYGAIVEKVIRREGHSITELAIVANVNRRSIYNWFLQPRLKAEIIIRIGRAIGHDFSVELPKLFVSQDFQVETKIETVPNTGKLEDLDAWKEKYIDLLERYNLLLSSQQNTSAGSFTIVIDNDKRNEYKLKLNNPPSDLFLEKCKKAGYRIKGTNRGTIGIYGSSEDQHHRVTTIATRFSA